MAQTGNGLEAVAPFIGEILQAVEPGARKRLVDKLMRLARRANAQRIAKNVEPEGNPMVPRKKRHDPKSKPKRGKMFKRIGKASNLKIRATPEMGELRFGNALVERTAAVHHFGLEDYVGKTRAGKVIRTKYQARELLGFGKEQELFADEVLRHVEGL